jgi:endogenous inhibitor of DNA gyrase (YacG/DUF329 family)
VRRSIDAPRQNMPSCPICERPSPPREHNAAFPFCTARCKQVDLGHWLDERYRVPTSDAPDARPDWADSEES